MKIIIEAEISDTEAEKLEEMGYDVNYPFSTNVTLDYGDKVIYGNLGKIWKIWKIWEKSKRINFSFLWTDWKLKEIAKKIV